MGVQGSLTAGKVLEGAQEMPRRLLPIGPLTWNREQVLLVYPSSKEQGFLHLSGPVIAVPGRGAEYSALVAAKPGLWGK